jgi:hypothetical protein
MVGENGFTVNVAEAESPPLPVTVTVYVPEAVAATVKAAEVILPLDIEHAAEETRTGEIGVDVMDAAVHVSGIANPSPVTITLEPVGPDAGESAMCGPVTMKFADPVSPVLPFTVTTYVPGVAVPETVKLLPLNRPEEVMVQVEAVTMFVGVLKTLVHAPASPLLKPLPPTVTAVPAEPPVGVRVMVGAVVVTVKVAAPVSPVLPLTVTT